MRIETDELIVRNFTLADKADLCEYMLQRVDAQFEQYADFTVEKAEKEIAFRAASDEFFAIELKRENKVIGNIYLGKREFNAREIGYVLNEHYQGKGFCSAAARAVLDWAFETGVHRVYAECAPQNIASWRVMEKIGLLREGRLSQNVSFHNDEAGNPIYWDTYIYGAVNPKA